MMDNKDTTNEAATEEAELVTEEAELLTEEAELLTEDLIEDVSIDGMCGVY